MMGAFAEFERNIIRKRQAEGIAKAKAKGVYVNHGRKNSIDRDKVHKLRAEGLSTYKIAEKMNISRMSVHRILNGR
jgi:DNA invertase Pin-like site-specific DNA recombinase